jgi:hypothetical protein
VPTAKESPDQIALSPHPVTASPRHRNAMSGPPESNQEHWRPQPAASGTQDSFHDMHPVDPSRYRTRFIRMITSLEESG